MSNPLKITIIRTSAIGDVVLATVCIDQLEKLNQPYQLTWIGKDPSLSLLKEAFPSKNFIHFSKDKNIFSLARDLKEMNLVVDLQTSVRSLFLGFILALFYRVPVFRCKKAQFYRSFLVFQGWLRGRSGKFQATSVKPKQYEMMRETLLRALALQNAQVARPSFPLPQKYDIHPELHSDIPWLAIGVGGAHETKKAPLDVFANILKKAQNSFAAKGKKFGLLFIGDKKDYFEFLKLREKLDDPTTPTLNLAGTLSLWQTTLHLSQCKVILSNDSSLPHLAEAVKTPTATLFGPTVEEFGFSPHLKESQAFSSDVGCRPCSKHGKNPCRFADKLCFLQINTEQVAEFLIQKLSHPLGEVKDIL